MVSCMYGLVDVYCSDIAVILPFGHYNWMRRTCGKLAIQKINRVSIKPDYRAPHTSTPSIYTAATLEGASLAPCATGAPSSTTKSARYPGLCVDMASVCQCILFPKPHMYRRLPIRASPALHASAAHAVCASNASSAVVRSSAAHTGMWP